MRIISLVCILFVVCRFTAIAQYSQVKGVLKMQEKARLEKAQKLLVKAIAKDPNLSAVLYAESAILFDSAYQAFDIDLAYKKLLSSKSNYASLEANEMEKHAKVGVDLIAIDELKKRIETTAYVRAVSQNTEADFLYYLETFADSDFEKKAIYKRDSLAFLTAASLDTYESYEDFMVKYPDAQDVGEAKRRYERLYFNKSTADGKLESFVSFLKTYPATEYRADAEKRIFEIITADNSTESFRKFISAYPESNLVPKAHRLSFYLSNSRNGYQSDSVRRVKDLLSHKELIVIHENGKYGFMDVDGKIVIEPSYNFIEQDYLCQPLTNDYFVTHSYIVALDGSIIFEDAITEVIDIGLGILKVSTTTGNYAVHKSGWKIVLKPHDDFKIVGQYIAYEVAGKWGLMTLAGLQLTDAQFSEISNQGDFYLFYIGDQFDVLNIDRLAKSANSEPINFQPLYEDFLLIDGTHILLQTALGQVVFDEQLNEKVPYNEQEIWQTENGYLVHKKEVINLLNSDFEVVSTQQASTLEFNESYALLTTSDTQLVVSLTNNYNLVEADSATLLGTYFAKYSVGDISYLAFKGDTTLMINSLSEVKLITSESTAQYLAIKNSKNNWQVFDQSGHAVLEGPYDEIVARGEEYLVVTSKGKKGLYSSTGKEILPISYGAIANYSNGYISYFDDRKFGVVNDQLGILVSNDYEKNILPYNDKYFVVEKDKKVGLVDSIGINITAIEYEEIVYWNDTSALVKQDFQWKILNIKTNRVEGESFKSFQVVKTEKEQIIIVLVENTYGVLSSTRGMIIPPTFNDIINVGSKATPVYFAEKHVEEANFYIVIYYNANGELIRKQVFEAEEYALIYCED